MKHDEVVGLRLPSKLRSALEKARRELSATTGVELNTSAVIRMILERELLKTRSDVDAG